MRSEIQNYAYILSRVYQYESRLKTAIVHIKSEIQTMQKYRSVIDYASKRFEAIRSKYTSFVAYPVQCIFFTRRCEYIALEQIIVIEAEQRFSDSIFNCVFCKISSKRKSGLWEVIFCPVEWR